MILPMTSTIIINHRHHQKHVVILQNTAADILSTILGGLLTTVSITQAIRNHPPTPKTIKPISASVVNLPTYSHPRQHRYAIPSTPIRELKLKHPSYQHTSLKIGIYRFPGNSSTTYTLTECSAYLTVTSIPFTRNPWSPPHLHSGPAPYHDSLQRGAI